jgi:hypothetical protein
VEPLQEPSESAPEAATPECAELRTELARACEGALVPEAGSPLRAHLRACRACEAEYREALRVTAHIARERRLAREEQERARRRNERLRLARSPRSRRSYSLAIRTLVLPALLILLLTRTSSNEVEAHVKALKGEYSLGVRRIDASKLPQPLRRGDWIVTGDDSAASLTLGARNEVLLEPRTRVCVEDRGLERMLFDSGAVVLRGTRTLTTAHAVIELEKGELRAVGDGAGLDLELRSGSCVISDAHGERVLRAGERARVGAR